MNIPQNVAVSSSGILFGLGVGPGDPDLITLKAVKTLQKIDLVLAAASSKNESSLAFSIAKPHLPDHVEVVRLDFPMTQDTLRLRQAWQSNAQLVADLLHEGKKLAFLTLGDPLIYSTFGYLMRTLLALDETFCIEVIPGISSFQAAAAKTRTVLCEGGENLLLLAGINTQGNMSAKLAAVDGSIIVKTYRNAAAVYAAVQDSGRGGEAVFASRVGLEGELVVKGIQNAPKTPHYLSLVLVPPARG